MNYLKEIFGHSRWTASAAIYSILVQAVLYLLITRFISVDNLGIYALASSFVFIGVTVIDSSFASSIIQTDRPSKEDYQSVIGLNFLLALLMAPLLFVLVAAYSKLSDNSSILVPALSLLPILLLSALISVQFTGLKKNMRFKALAMIDIISTSVQVGVIVILALNDFQLWALIIGIYAKYLVILLVLIFANLCYALSAPNFRSLPWRPHYNFGQYIIAEKGLSTLISYADVYLVGHFLGLSQLGIYDILRKLVMRPVVIMYSSIEQIIYPLLSHARREASRYNRIFGEFSKLISLIFISGLMLIYIYSWLILQLFPEPYNTQSQLLQGLVLWAATIVLVNPIDIILYSVGRTRLFLKWFVMTNILIILVMSLSMPFGMMPFLYCMSGLNLMIWLASYPLLIAPSSQLKTSIYFLIGRLGLPLILLVVFISFLPFGKWICTASATLIVVMFVIFSFRSLKQIPS